MSGDSRLSARLRAATPATQFGRETDNALTSKREQPPGQVETSNARCVHGAVVVRGLAKTQEVSICKSRRAVHLDMNAFAFERLVKRQLEEMDCQHCEVTTLYCQGAQR